MNKYWHLIDEMVSQSMPSVMPITLTFNRYMHVSGRPQINSLNFRLNVAHLQFHTYTRTHTNFNTSR